LSDLAVLIDTDVFSLLFVDPRRPDKRRTGWRNALAGRAVVIAAQTRAEVLAGARMADWGPPRYADLLAQLDATATLPVTAARVAAYAELKAECRRMGHSLWQKLHDGDRWVAASAIAFELPLLAGDAIYEGVPGVRPVHMNEGGHGHE
jgi:predicted nucleic acid-binding protein